MRSLRSAERFTNDGWRRATAQDQPTVTLATLVAVAYFTPGDWAGTLGAAGVQIAQGVEPPTRWANPFRVNLGGHLRREEAGVSDVLLMVTVQGVTRGCLVTVHLSEPSPLLLSEPALVP